MSEANIKNKDLANMFRANDTNVKQAKAKVESFNKNYFNPLFVPIK